MAPDAAFVCIQTPYYRDPGFRNAIETALCWELSAPLHGRELIVSYEPAAHGAPAARPMVFDPGIPTRQRLRAALRALHAAADYIRRQAASEITP